MLSSKPVTIGECVRIKTNHDFALKPGNRNSFPVHVVDQIKSGN
jgi:hypothetical protein